MFEDIKEDTGEVAPCVGAWIETVQNIRTSIRKLKSLPAWERGLKRIYSFFTFSPYPSLPAWERGLKLKSPEVLR